jgi:hypothetical protein
MEAAGRKKLLFLGVGDRSDEVIKTSILSTINSFDVWYLRDFPDLRGREPGELPLLMKKYLVEAGKPESDVHAMDDYAKAFEIVLEQGEPGDLILIITTNKEMSGAWQRLEAFRDRELQPPVSL